jgi:predicted nucleotidyltransferase
MADPLSAPFEIFALPEPPTARTGPAPTLAELRGHRAAIEAIVRRYRGSNVRVFGSVARGDARPDSDVDLLVDLAPEATLLDLGGMDTELRKLLDRDVDVVELHEDSSPRFRERVVREAVPL